MKDTEIKNLPEGWKWIKLGGKTGIADIVNGSTPSTDAPEYWGGDILWATPSDLGNSHSIYIENTERKITKAGLGSCSTTLLPIETVLLTSRAPVGNIAIAKKPICTNQGFKSFIPRDGINSLYLYFAIKKIVPKIQKASHGNTFTEITKELVQDFKIPLPPTIDDQIRIASELERKMAEVETMRQAAKRQLEAAKAMSSALLSEIFSCDTFKDFELVRLEDWACSVASGQAVSSVGGTYQERGIRYIQGKNLTNEGFAIDPVVYIGMETHAAMSRSVVKPKDVLINIVGPPIGKICWYPEGQPEANTNQAIVRVHCPDDLDYRFLTYLLRTREYYNYFFEVKVGVRQWNISRTNCADIRIPRVPLALQHGLVKKFEEKMVGNLLVHAMKQQLEAVESLPGAILREVFDFEEDT